MQVRLLRTWGWPDLMQQTPGRSKVWGGIQFTEDPIDDPDFCVVLNNLGENINLPLDKDKIFRVVQEPPTECVASWHQNPSYSALTFTCDPELSGDEYVKSHPMVPWHVNRDYDYLVAASIPEKVFKASWITSTKNALVGHRKRMNYVNVIREKLPEVNLLGTEIHHITNPEERKSNFDEQLQLGFKIVEDKWAGLAPYKYSLAVENFSGPDYWTEKIADCFLAWTLPIYYGCSNLEKYFPEDSFVRIDINDVEESVKTIRQLLEEDSWIKRLPAIMEARELILNKYQLFPQISEAVRNYGLSNSRKFHVMSAYEFVSQTTELKSQIAIQQSMIMKLSGRIEAIENSLSWQITSPLRRIGNLISRFN